MKESKYYLLQNKQENFVPLIIFFLLAILFGCENKYNNTNKEKIIDYPDGKPGNYVLLSDSVIKDFNLNEEEIKSFQYYLSDDLEINLLYENDTIRYNKPAKETQSVNIKTIFIKKHTPCVIVKKLFTESEVKLLMKKSPIVMYRDGYVVDVGNGLTLIYYQPFKCFSDINNIDEKKSKINSSFTNIRFVSNSGLLVDLSHPKIKYKNEDTLIISGKRK